MPAILPVALDIYIFFLSAMLLMPCLGRFHLFIVFKAMIFLFEDALSVFLFW
jgi:hypothetical protein